MKTILSLVWTAAFMTVQAAADYTQLQRIWSVEPERIEAAIKAFPEAFKDGFILSAFPETLKLGPVKAKDFATQKAFVVRFQAQGVPVQICVSSTLGHTDAWTLPGDYPKMVGSKGQVAQAMVCPRSAAFKVHLRDRFARYAALHPTVLWLDDDFRMPHHPPVDFACFCDGCLAAFEAKSGLGLDRAALVKAVLDDAIVKDVNVRDAWGMFATEALNDLVQEVATAVHAVDADIALGFMVINPSGVGYGERDFRKWRKLGRNRKGEVWFRPGSGAYTDTAPFSPDGILAKNIQIGRLVAMTESAGVINVAEEVTCPYDRAAKSMRMTFFECALNIGLAGCDGTTFDAIKPNLAEQLGEGAIVEMLNTRRGELARMREMIRGRRQIGVAVPPLVVKRGKVKSFYALCSHNQEALLKKLGEGIPLTFRAADAWATLDSFDRAQLPARLDAPTRAGLSLWESSDGAEWIGFVWNFGYDDLSTARLLLSETAQVEALDAQGEWKVVGFGKDLSLPSVAPWSVQVLRLARNVRPARVSVDFNVEVGPVKPVNAVGQPPKTGLIKYGLFRYLTEAGIPYSRLHDVGGPFGQNVFVDIPNLFRDFDADETEPANYDFAFTDQLMDALVTAKVEPYFRLGVTIENYSKVKSYRIAPPKDYAKWARICEHVIRHYTEGWANGRKMKISYWEIWNEADNWPRIEDNNMWAASYSEYIKLYDVAARHLKTNFPHLKIGGPALCGFGACENPTASPRALHFEKCAREFLAHIRDTKCPLDFFSYHSYAEVDEMMRQVTCAQRMLVEYGLGSVETWLNEWLPRPCVPERLGTPEQAADIAAALIGFQNAKLWGACIYDARCALSNYAPLFNPMTRQPHKAYYAFYDFNELMKCGGRAVKVWTDAVRGLWATAAKGENGAAVMLANSSTTAIPLAFDFGGREVCGCRLTDAMRTDSDVPLPTFLPPSSFAVILLK